MQIFPDKLPFGVLGMVALAGENVWGEMIASTASVATLANFALGNPLSPKYKIACWDSPKPLCRKFNASPQ